MQYIIRIILKYIATTLHSPLRGLMSWLEDSITIMLQERLTDCKIHCWTNIPNFRIKQFPLMSSEIIVICYKLVKNKKSVITVIHFISSLSCICAGIGWSRFILGKLSPWYIINSAVLIMNGRLKVHSVPPRLEIIKNSFQNWNL